MDETSRNGRFCHDSGFCAVGVQRSQRHTTESVGRTAAQEFKALSCEEHGSSLLWLFRAPSTDSSRLSMQARALPPPSQHGGGQDSTLGI